MIGQALMLAAAGGEMANGDIILRVLIGMAFIMVLMFLSVIVTGKIGQLRERKLSEQSTQQSCDDEDIPDEQ